MVVAHVLPTLPPFLRALDSIGRVAAVVPKPRSIDPVVLGWLRDHHPVTSWSRASIGTPGFVDRDAAAVLDGDTPFVVLDIGGYFAPALPDLARRYPGTFLGVVEDTENGYQKYLTAYRARPHLPVPCVSIARSLSKRSEDHLVGRSIVFSSEVLLREGGATLGQRSALVIGFGKIGQSIAHDLRDRGIDVSVWDIDPNQRVFARCTNFRVEDRARSLQRADLVFCATGNRSLRAADFRALRRGAVVFSVTSSDDEFSFAGLDDYASEQVGPWMTRLHRVDGGDHHFFLANRGDAPNFLHGAEVRPFVHLTQAAILHGIAALLDDPRPGRIGGIGGAREALISEAFERCFFDTASERSPA
ncbi:hypothetical protein BJF78_02365 [Pseudonocardia sp. CNS-139]|nr:hypothetical protein BJF78_02365 [Pseudonocardia sp. CNS-139]